MMADATAGARVWDVTELRDGWGTPVRAGAEIRIDEEIKGSEAAPNA